MSTVVILYTIVDSRPYEIQVVRSLYGAWNISIFL